MNNKMKIEVNGKQYTFRFNSSKLQFECNYGYKDNFGQSKKEDTQPETESKKIMENVSFVIEVSYSRFNEH